VFARYTALEASDRAAGFTDEADWLKGQVQKIRQE
jgi:hypothetical protein